MCLQGREVTVCGLTGGSAVICTQLFPQSQISGAVDSHTHIHFSTLHCTTQPLTNNLTHCGMWLNAKAQREQVLMNHKQPQDSRAPAPHITLTIIIIIIPSFALSFLRCLAVAKTTACYLRSDQHVLAEGLPPWIPTTGFTFGWSATGVSIPLQTGEGWKDWSVNEGRTQAQDSWDKDYLWTKGQKKKIPNNLYSIYFILL